MVHELKQFIESGKVVFGVKQTLKNSKNLNKVFVASDCRNETIEKLQKSNVDIEILENPGHEVSNKLELDFKCEVFGIKN